MRMLTCCWEASAHNWDGAGGRHYAYISPPRGCGGALKCIRHLASLLTHFLLMVRLEMVGQDAAPLVAMKRVCMDSELAGR